MTLELILLLQSWGFESYSEIRGLIFVLISLGVLVVSTVVGLKKKSWKDWWVIFSLGIVFAFLYSTMFMRINLTYTLILLVITAVYALRSRQFYKAFFGFFGISVGLYFWTLYVTV
ncbi:hypothetical protein [Maritalea mediterranea]|uniref:Uncharacterized protein n=1 Tax=Maritalea mediterranea TaxID=2909667 RepID=A0ABS9E6X1_9HYPH|nr:hypothetical protein [Maritalea mediterranea]MCF4098601.1 hypothetical protein [Maritalea mediterranea]